MHLLPEVRPPLLAWLILTTHSTELTILLRSSSRWNAASGVRWLRRDLEWLSGLVTREGQGGAWPTKNRDIGPKMLVIYHRTRKLSHALISSLLRAVIYKWRDFRAQNIFVYVCGACCVIIPWYCIVGGRWAPGNWDIWWEAGGVLKLCQHQWNFFTQLQSCKRLHNWYYDHDINILCTWRFFF